MNSASDESLSGSEVIMKRPFCNAFTGCGRKRAFDGMEESASQERMEESGSEGSSMDTMMKLSEKIMDEARAWEDLQRHRRRTSGPPYQFIPPYF